MSGEKTDWAAQRQEMVAEQIAARGVDDARVLGAMSQVPRHEFVPEENRALSYDDGPLPIGGGQTISQPYIVALMTELAELEPGHKVLEVGTGCGYQAAVLAQITKEVYSIEIVQSLCMRAQNTLRRLNYVVQVRCGDGYAGWPQAAPFDAILVTAAPDHVPPALVEQLKIGGRLVIPVGTHSQDLLVIRKTPTGITERSVIPVVFVPMTGEAQQRRR